MPTKKSLPKSKTGFKNFRTKFKFNRPTAIAFAVIATVFGLIVLIKTFASSGTLRPQGTYTNWQWPSSAPQQHSSLETNLAIDSDPTQVHAGYGYYWASQFGMVENGGYMGIQTKGEAGTYTGKVAIFALFGANQGVQNGSAGSNCAINQDNFDGGGSGSKGSTCRLPLNWRAGDVYRLRVAVAASDSTTRTWQAIVINTKTGQQQIIGNIKTAISYGLLKPWVSNWTEYYSSGRDSCEMPYSNVVFGAPKFSDSYYPSSHQNNLTDGGCASKITDSGNIVRHEQGNKNSVVPPLPTGGTYISDMNWTYATTGYGVITRDQSVNNNGTPINLAGRTYAKGLGAHAISDIRYNLAGNYAKFVSHVNLQYGATGTISYQVWADGTKLFDSGTMDGLSITKAINVDVTGKNELKLIVTDSGDGIGADWAAWADARLISAAVVTPPPTTHPPTTPPPTTPPPIAPPSTPGSNPSDSTAPSVTISSPANGSRVYNGVYIVANSSDNVGVTKIELYVDGVLKSSAVSSSISYTWVSYYAAAGNHSISVKAYDAAGNVGQSTITVVK